MPCDVVEAIEDALWTYFWKKLQWMLIKLVGKRVALALAVFLGAAIADGPLPVGDIIGAIVALGIGLWTAWDIFQTIREAVEVFRNRRGVYRSLELIAKTAIDRAFKDCLDNDPECCEIIRKKIKEMMDEWVKRLRPGWKKRGEARKQRKKIRDAITPILRECCGD